MTPDVPAGAQCFVDANILVYCFIPHPDFSPPSEVLLGRIQRGELEARTSPMVVAEALHRIMLSEVRAKFVTPKPLAYIQRRPQLVASLSLYPQAATALSLLPLSYLPVDAGVFVSATAIAAAENLLTDDASIVALMRRHGIQYLASNDDEFDSVGGITVCKPR